MRYILPIIFAFASAAVWGQDVANDSIKHQHLNEVVVEGANQRASASALTYIPTGDGLTQTGASAWQSITSLIADGRAADGNVRHHCILMSRQTTAITTIRASTSM